MSTHPANDPAPLPGIASRRSLANRASVYATQLRQLAGDIEQASLRPSDWRAAGIREADRSETVAAGERLREAIAAEHAGSGEPAAWASATRAGTVTMQLAAILSSKAVPSALRGWAERWETWAGEVGP